MKDCHITKYSFIQLKLNKIGINKPNLVNSVIY